MCTIVHTQIKKIIATATIFFSAKWRLQTKKLILSNKFIPDFLAFST